MEPFGLFLVGLVMVVGLVGVVVPFLPGTSIVLAAGIAWAVLLVDGGATRWVVVALMAALFAVGVILKYVLPGRRLHGSLPRRTLVVGGAGALVGLIVLPPFGLLLGAVAGTYLAEASRLGYGAPAVRSTVEVLRAVGLGLLAELTAGVVMVGIWLVGLLVV